MPCLEWKKLKPCTTSSQLLLMIICARSLKKMHITQHPNKDWGRFSSYNFWLSLTCDLTKYFTKTCHHSLLHIELQSKSDGTVACGGRFQLLTILPTGKCSLFFMTQRWILGSWFRKGKNKSYFFIQWRSDLFLQKNKS